MRKVIEDMNAKAAHELWESQIDWETVMSRIPKGYKLGKNIQGKALKKGMKVVAAYRQFNEGADFLEILGVTSNEEKYGKGDVKYNSVQDALRANGVRSLAQLEAKDEEYSKEKGYGHSHYLCTKDILSGDKGCWFYLFEGRWARGSGAERLTFVELEKA